ncbi:MAG: immunoglobulin-like domain-containing protein [Candidatus Paceibacterota bacterium]|jgi:hypothetical protein
MNKKLLTSLQLGLVLFVVLAISSSFLISSPIKALADASTTKIGDGSVPATETGYGSSYSGAGMMLMSLPLVLAPIPPANAGILTYLISEPIISPDNSTSVGTKDNTSIDIAFSSQVDTVDLDIVDGLDNLIKHLYTGNNVTDPLPKPWDGKDGSSNFVSDGTYTIKITYSDAGGTTIDTSRTIIVDNTSPVVTQEIIPSAATTTGLVIGGNSIAQAEVVETGSGISGGCFFTFDGASTWNYDPAAFDSVTSRCSIAHTIIPDGSSVDIKVFDVAGNQSTVTNPYINVVWDKEAPTVGPISFSPSEVIGSDLYLSPLTTISATATDIGGIGVNPNSCRYSIDGGSSWVLATTAYNSTTNSCVINSIDTSIASGVTVSIDDLAANSFDTSSSWVPVKVDTVVPVITLLGDATVNLKVSDTYVEAGATALDSLDGDITSRIVTTGLVNTSVVGTYILTYNVSDDLGNVATAVTRTVKVEPAPGSSSHTGDYIPGWGPGRQIRGQVLGTSTAKIIRASTTNTTELARQKKIQQLKKKLNDLKVQRYNLKHSQAALAAQGGANTTIDNPNLKPTSTASTTPAKPFWKFW